MTLWCHEGERFFIGIKHQHTCGKLYAPRHGRVNKYNFAGGNTCERSIEMVTGWPELWEMRLPSLDDLIWPDRSAMQTNTIDFLPHLTEALEWPDDLLPLYIQIHCSSWYTRDFQCRDLLHPIRSITRFTFIRRCGRSRHGMLDSCFCVHFTYSVLVAEIASASVG